MSLSPSWSESNTSKVGGYASSTSELVQSLKGFVSGSFKISSCDRSIALPLLHGCPSLRQWIVSSWDPSTGRFSAQLVNDFLINSVGSWLQASRIWFARLPLELVRCKAKTCRNFYPSRARKKRFERFQTSWQFVWIYIFLKNQHLKLN